MAARHDKGKRFERDTGKFLLDNDGPCPKWGEMASSTGRIGHITELEMDLISKSYIGEAKVRKSAPGWLIGAWKKVIERAEEHGKEALLALKKDYAPPMHIITPERHAELLKYERMVNDETG